MEILLTILAFAGIGLGIVALCWLWLASAFGTAEGLSRDLHDEPPLTWREFLTMSYMD